MAVTVQVLVIEKCPRAEPVARLVREVVARLVPRAQVEVLRVEDEDEAGRLGFAGSPTILVNGRDAQDVAVGERVAGLACRLYDGPAGLPPEWLIEAALLRTLPPPRHILFLCVANSARSQMAEAIARQLAPPDVTISSAGSAPAPRTHPLSIRALAEIGIDASNQRPKLANEVRGPTVNTVITLCAEEVCPVYLGKACRVHWALPDPAQGHGTEEERLEAFRRVRNELRRRLERIFSAT